WRANAIAVEYGPTPPLVRQKLFGGLIAPNRNIYYSGFGLGELPHGAAGSRRVVINVFAGWNSSLSVIPSGSVTRGTTKRPRGVPLPITPAWKSGLCNNWNI